MHKGLIWGAVAALGLAAPAFADDFKYSYLDLGYISTNYDDNDSDSDGFGLRGSLALTGQLNLIGSFSTQDLDFGFDTRTYSIGAGLHWPLNPNLDILTELSYVRAELDTNGFGTFDDDGIQVGLGLRGRVLPQLELTGQIDYVNFDSGGDDTNPTFGARYYLNDNLAVFTDLTLLDDDGMGWFIGGRLNLGR